MPVRNQSCGSAVRNPPSRIRRIANEGDTGQNLSHYMDFDHIVTIHEGGELESGPTLHVPDLLDEELDSDDWELLTGYTGQYGYNGPVMHNSEFIGGRLARDILDSPGIYVAIVSHWSEDDESEGWAIARYIGEKS